jgi:uncharacterized protein YecE (DUF72 family)
MSEARRRRNSDGSSPLQPLQARKNTKSAAPVAISSKRRRKKFQDGTAPRAGVFGYTLARMAKVHAGTSGWAYSSWKRGFYPPKLGSANFLNYYATRLNSVEVNYTFTNSLTKELANRWIEATPADFQFAVKAHQSITHFQRLRAARGITRKFIASLKPFLTAKKLGPVLFQLPPNFKCDLKRLESFLTGFPHPLRAAFEFRHPSWFVEDVFVALRKANVALCLAESDKLQTPDVQTADFFYLRLRKEKYSSVARKQISASVADLATRGDVFVYFKHEDTPEGAIHAERLLQSVGK